MNGRWPNILPEPPGPHDGNNAATGLRYARPQKDGIAARFETFLKTNHSQPGAELLKGVYSCCLPEALTGFLPLQAGRNEDEHHVLCGQARLRHHSEPRNQELP